MNLQGGVFQQAGLTLSELNPEVRVDLTMIEDFFMATLNKEQSRHFNPVELEMLTCAINAHLSFNVTAAVNSVFLELKNPRFPQLMV